MQVQVFNASQRLGLQAFFAFLVGNQLTHYYFNPLADVAKLTNEKYERLWDNYLRIKKEEEEARARAKKA